MFLEVKDLARFPWRRTLALFCVFGAAWLGIRWLFPLFFPFFLGGTLALLAEPAVKFFSRKMPRAGASVLAVGILLLLLAGLLVLLCSAILRNLGLLAKALPDMERTASNALSLLRSRLTLLAEKLPENLQPMAHHTLSALFESGMNFTDDAVRALPAAMTGFLGAVSGSALTVGTGVLSAFMISLRLPKIQKWLAQRFPPERREAFLLRLTQIRSAVGGWLRAQSVLLLLTFLIVSVGLLILRIPYAPLWAGGVALVDALPVLGSGTVLLPWALISLLQGQLPRALGLLATYACAALTRSTLEPRLVGRHLGLDPLVTLACLYLGYRLWGFGGMILSPMLGSIAMELARN